MKPQGWHRSLAGTVKETGVAHTPDKAYPSTQAASGTLSLRGGNGDGDERGRS